MPLRDLAHRWNGTLLRHRPATSTRSVLDDTYLGVAADNRWNDVGVPAYYFALDLGLIIAEYGRHVGVDLPAGKPERLARSLWSVPVHLESVLDLTDPAIVAAAGARPIKEWVLDVAATQSMATYLRTQVPELDGLIVPSVAFLDHPERFDVVVFRDRIDPATAFGAPAHVRDIVLEAIGGA